MWDATTQVSGSAGSTPCRVGQSAATHGTVWPSHGWPDAAPARPARAGTGRGPPLPAGGCRTPRYSSRPRRPAGAGASARPRTRARPARRASRSAPSRSADSPAPTPIPADDAPSVAPTGGGAAPPPLRRRQGDLQLPRRRGQRLRGRCHTEGPCRLRQASRSDNSRARPGRDFPAIPSAARSRWIGVGFNNRSPDPQPLPCTRSRARLLRGR